MRRSILGAALLLASCGGDGDGDEVNGQASQNQIERLATPKQEEPDLQASARLEPITLADLDREGLLGAGCEFSREGQMLLAAVGSDALVRIQGELRHMIHSAPVGPTGGFFEDRQLSISVGRTEEAGSEAEAVAWPARLTVTNRRTEAEQELRGTWTCGS